MKKFIVSFAAAAVLTLIGSAQAQVCYNNHVPVVQAVLISVAPNGDMNYALYSFDSDTAGVAPAIAIKNTQGKILLTSQNWYTPFLLKKGTGSAHVEATNMDTCNRYGSWLRLSSPRFWN